MAPTRTAENVLLVVLDSVRARNCSLYRYRRRTTPYLESLAAESTVYTQARAPSNWSLPSHVSLFTGLETHEHRVTVHDRLREGHSVFEQLADRGYATGLFTENGFLASHAVGLKACFQTVETVPEQYPAAYDTGDRNPGPDGYYYADKLVSWITETDCPWAACLNLMEAHRPYEPRDRFDRWGDTDAWDFQRSLPTRWEWEFHDGPAEYDRLMALQSLYDGAIRQTDAVLERVVESLRRTGRLEETLLVVCSDHGDGFGEPGMIAHEPPAVSHIVPMNEPLLHVPLVVRPPGGSDRRPVSAPARLTAFPTVVEDAIEGRDTSGGFVADCVYATKQPVTGDLRERYRRRCESVSPYAAASRAVYRPDPDVPGAVRKRYFWGQAGVSCRIRHAGHVRRLDDVAPGCIDAGFDAPTADVSEPRNESVSQTTRERLAALGYY